MDVGDVWLASEADRGLLNVWGTTADRAAGLQKLNAELRGGVLATPAVVEGLEDVLLTRRLGDFPLKGLDEPVRAVEILMPAERASQRDCELCRRFEGALREYEQGHIFEARSAFAEIGRDFPGDGATLWYLTNRLGFRPPGEQASDRPYVGVVH